MSNDKKLLDKCLCCGSGKLRKVFDMGNCPLTDLYKRNEDESIGLRYYKCMLNICIDCGHCQLEEAVDPKQSYDEYIYNSRVTTGLNRAFEDYAKSIINIFKDNHRQISILDVGSNDGSFLTECEKYGMRGYGVEPAKNLAEVTSKKGIKTYKGYFDEEFIEFLPNWDRTYFDVITFNNVLANIDDPLGVLKKAKDLIREESGKIIIQTGYHPKQFSSGLFDYIYHEHYSYFSEHSLYRLSERAGLNIVNVEYSNIRGGTIRVTLDKRSNSIKREKKYERFTSESEIKDLSKLVDFSKEYLKGKLDDYEKRGYNLIGFGASHSTGMLVHKFDLKDRLAYIVDENKDKEGLFMPGTGLRVKLLKELEDVDNTIIIILAWQYYEQIKEKLIKKGFKSDQILKPVLP